MMIPISETKVVYGPVQHHGMDGMRVVFQFGEKGPCDIFEFYRDSDIQHVLRLIEQGTEPDWLLISIRKLTGSTLH